MSQLSAIETAIDKDKASEFCVWEIFTDKVPACESIPEVSAERVVGIEFNSAEISSINQVDFEKISF